MLNRCLRNYFRKIKNIKSQSWVIPPIDATQKFADADLSHLDIKQYKDIKMNLNNGLEGDPKPISPILGPITIKNPKIHDKQYKWCSCGQSLKQPFCDNSHKGTAFKPLKFTIEENVKQIKLCGCKLTKQKPFCDGKGCTQKQ